MKNITNLYRQLNEGKISKDFFMKTARMQFPQFISPVTSYRDAVNILSGKRLIEAQTLDTHQMIDRLNPYHFRKGVQKELQKISHPTREDIERVNAKVAKRLMKDPMAYEDQIFHNAKDVAKRDDKLQTTEVKAGSQTTDKNNAMKAKKKLESANTRASKKENRKGKPKGVKVMTYKAKTAPGISQTMPATGKETVLKENMYHEWHVNREVNTPKGPGSIKEIHGGTLTVELKDGSLAEYQMNVIEKYTKEGMQPNVNNEPKKDNKTSKLKEVTNKLKEFVKKLKEVAVISADDEETGQETIIGTAPNKAKAAAQVNAYKKQGVRTVKSKVLR